MPKELPVLRGESLYIPFVGAIIERTTDLGQRQILIQTRAKKSELQHDNVIEIPGGKMRAFEEVFDTVRREVKEETGLDVTFIVGESKRIDYPNNGDLSTLVEPFCVTQIQTGPFIGLIFLCSAVGFPALVTDETKEARWINIEELNRLINSSPERFYTPFLGPLRKYLQIHC